MVAPGLLLAEVGNVLWQRLRKGLIPASQAEEIARHLPGVFAALVETSELFTEAVRIARDIDHPIYDCFYLAVAKRWDAPLVTADNALLAKVIGTEWATQVMPLRNVPVSR